MTPATAILVVGDALLDVSVTPSEPIRPGGDVRAEIRLGPGGQGANVAVRLARRGIAVRLACALADDAAGRLVRDALDMEGIAIDAAPADATGSVVIMVDAQGERTMLSHRTPIPPRSVEPAPWTVVSGYTLLGDGELELRGSGRRAVLGCSVPPGTEEAWWLRADELRPDLVILNAEEAAAIGADARSLALEAAALVVITGPDGAIAAAAHPDAGVRRANAERATGLDSTGAGDAFAAAFIAELHDEPMWGDADLDRALAAGLRLAAQVASVTGAQARVEGERPGRQPG